jgi:hypothetical protein
MYNEAFSIPTLIAGESHWRFANYDNATGVETDPGHPYLFGTPLHFTLHIKCTYDLCL